MQTNRTDQERSFIYTIYTRTIFTMFQLITFLSLQSVFDRHW